MLGICCHIYIQIYCSCIGSLSLNEQLEYKDSLLSDQTYINAIYI